MIVAFVVFYCVDGAAGIKPGSWEYKDLIAIILSAVSIVVTFLGIIIAIAAIWGFQTLKALAEEKAVEASRLGSAAYLKSEEFKTDLKAEIQVAMQAAAREAVQDALAPVVVGADVAPEFQVRDEEWRD